MTTATLERCASAWSSSWLRWISKASMASKEARPARRRSDRLLGEGEEEEDVSRFPGLGNSFLFLLDDDIVLCHPEVQPKQRSG